MMQLLMFCKIICLNTPRHMVYIIRQTFTQKYATPEKCDVWKMWPNTVEGSDVKNIHFLCTRLYVRTSAVFHADDLQNASRPAKEKEIIRVGDHRRLYTMAITIIVFVFKNRL